MARSYFASQWYRLTRVRSLGASSSISLHFRVKIRHGPVAKRTDSARTIARFSNWLTEPDRKLNLVPVDRQKVHVDTLAKRGDAHFCEPRLRRAMMLIGLA